MNSEERKAREWQRKQIIERISENVKTYIPAERLDVHFRLRRRLEACTLEQLAQLEIIEIDNWMRAEAARAVAAEKTNPLWGESGRSV